MIRKICYTLAALLLFYSCWDTETEMIRRTYVINNQSNQEVRLDFYNYNFEKDEYDVTNYHLTTNQKIERFTENSSGNFGNFSIGNSFMGDSCIIVFGKQDKHLIHISKGDGALAPSVRNLFNQNEYTEIEGKFNFYITQKDYESATPCNDDPICGE